MTMIFAFYDLIQIMVIPLAFAMDALVGDPRGLPHPIRWMGWAIERWEPVCRRFVPNEYLSGALFALTLITGCWAVTAMVVAGAHQIHPLVGFSLDVVLIFFCLSARSLSDAGLIVYRHLKRGEVEEARSALDMIVGRDVTDYSPDDMARATVETIAENFVDGVLSPLLFAAIGGAPLAMAYKMVNTLDSMVGYKNPRYERFGRIAARIDDAVNFLPARLSVLLIALAARLLESGGGRRGVMTAVREGKNHKSPNAGYPEAAFAGVLAVKLNGPNYYSGVLVEKPYIGATFGIVQIDHIQKSCDLMTVAALISTVVAWSLTMLLI